MRPSRKASSFVEIGAMDALVPVVLKSATYRWWGLVVAEDGQDLIEYALLAGPISLVAIAAILNRGTGMNTVWTGVDSTMGSIPTP